MCRGAELTNSSGDALSNETAAAEALASAAAGCWAGISFETAFRILLYAIIFVCAVVGNSLVIITLVQRRRMRTVTNVFLLNLAVSDLLLGVFCMPTTLVGSVLRNFVLGAAMCKLIPYLQAVSVSVSAWTLVSISLERFFAIVRPLESRRWQTRSHAYKVILMVWLCSMVTMLPIAVLSQLVPLRGERKKCREVWPNVTSERVFNVYLDVTLFLLPLVIMSFVYSCIGATLCHGMKIDNKKDEELMSTAVVHEEYHTNPNMPQLMAPPDVEARLQKMPRRQFIFRGNYRKSRASKRRVIRMLSVLVLEFFVCWTPLYVLHTWTVFDAHAAYSRVPAGAFAAVHLLAYVSSCCNPITYCFMHDKYRQAFRNVLACSSASSRRRRRWSSTKSHDRFVSLNSICSNGKNASGKGSLRSTFTSRLSSLKEERATNDFNEVAGQNHAVCKGPVTSLADGESSSSCNMSTYCGRRLDVANPSDTES
ncbi:cholecystokinin receptor type A-like isoform X4 [Dermacentor andersoni]|uniref:cholecystokinin receptor type A-like isoform X4 n=1 Tax=Dermacentor andersoni TaxID=34620 RepID=UPI002155047B|nr:cholecystokinin receptor type A-like isoform X4 [Dermacentor andersoni]